MIKGFIHVKPILTADDLSKLRAAAEDDNHHFPLYPTHAVFRDGEIVGSVAALSIPLLAVWAHSSKLTHRTTCELINTSVNIARARNGGNPIVTMCPPGSPIYPAMEGLGFVKFSETTLFLEAQ